MSERCDVPGTNIAPCCSQAPQKEFAGALLSLVASNRGSDLASAWRPDTDCADWQGLKLDGDKLVEL